MKYYGKQVYVIVKNIFPNQRTLSVIIIISVQQSIAKSVECTKKQGVNAHPKC